MRTLNLPWAKIFGSDVVESFRRSPGVVLATVVLAVLVLGSIFAPLWAPQNTLDPGSYDLMSANTQPATANELTGQFLLLGSDDQGRDLLSAVFYGTRISLVVAAGAVLFSAMLGIWAGLAAGFFGGWVDTIIMRLADIQLSLPSLFIALLTFGLTRSLLPASSRESYAVYIVILAIGISGWVTYARTVRGAVLVERNKEYVQAAEMLGLSSWQILVRHILPNVKRPVIIISTVSLALAVITEATLSYLGAGVPSTSPSLGTLIRLGQDYLFAGEWWIAFFPGFMLFLLAMSANIFGDWLRDVLDPKGGLK